MPGQKRGAKLAPCEQKIRESLLLSVKGTRTTSRWVGIMLLSWLMRLERDLVFLGAILAVDLGAVEGILGGDQLAAQVVAFSRSILRPSPTSLVRNQFATVMNSILGTKLGISMSAVHSRWPGSML